MGYQRKAFIGARWGMSMAVAAALLGAGLCHAGEREQIEADMQAQRWAQAQTELQGVIAKHPQNATAHYWLAQVDYKLGQWADASREAHRALQLDPSKHFTTNPGVLTQLLEAGGAPAGQAFAQPGAAGAMRAAVAVPAARAKSHLVAWLGLGLLVAVLFWVVLRRTTRVALLGERQKWEGALRQARQDLDDAIAASDANPALPPEVKLAQYDRAKKAQSAIAAHEATLATRSDFSETAELVARSHDVAAELRGEERPSDRLARIEAERAAAPVYVAGPAMPPAGWGGAAGGGLGAVAAGAAGVAAGVLLADAAQAASRPQGGGWWVDDTLGGAQPAPGGDFNVDLGSTDDTGGDWDMGGGSDLDLGGGSDF